MEKIFNDDFRHRLDSPGRKKILDPEKVMDIMSIKKGENILDIGAGTGYFFIPATQRADESNEMIASDISAKMLEEIKLKLGDKTENIRLLQEDARNSVLETNSIDKIILAFVYHEFDDTDAYLKEIKRILKPGGEIFILEWLPVESPSGPPMHERLTEETIENTMIKHAFRPKERHLMNEFNYLHVYSLKKEKH